MSDLEVLLIALSTTDLSDISNAIAVIRNILNFLVNLTPEERKVMRTIATRRVGYMAGVHDAVVDFSSAVPGTFSIPNFTTQKTLRENLGHICNEIGSLNEGIEDTMMLLDSVLLKKSDIGYGYLKTAARTNQGLSELVDDLGSIYKHKSPPAAEIVSLNPGATLTIYNVKSRTLLYNKGNAIVRFKAGSELATKVRMSWKYAGPGCAVMIPAGWSVLEVVNESPTEVAVISVRKI
jgi:hypothetical protein